MSSLLDIWWIQICIGTKFSESKWRYVWKPYLVHLPMHISVKYYWKTIQEYWHWLCSMKIEKNQRKIFRVFSCVIYKIISKYVCIDYLGYEKANQVVYVLEFMGGTNILIRIMTAYWDLELQIYYWICFIVRDYQRTMNLLSYSNVLIGCLNNILIKD